MTTSENGIETAHGIFNSNVYKDEFRRISGGIREGQWDLPAEGFANEFIYLPVFEEQKKIADHLDIKCNEIDSLISDIESEIDILEQYKTTVITEAVTKGLNSNVQMKDSGVQWIGNIPGHWNVIPFQYILKERNEKNEPVKTDERLSLSIDKGVTLYADKTTNLDRFKEDVSQYKLAHEGDFVMNSMNMIVGAVGISEYFGCVSPAYYVFYDDDGVTAKYCDFVFHTKIIQRVLFSMGKGIMAIVRGDDRVNTCRLKVSRYDLNKLAIPMPPLEERIEIVKYLEEKNRIIGETISYKQRQILTLQEYKKSVIYEYVTGKKEVPLP